MRVSFSGIDRLMSCRASAFLPRLADDEGSEAASRGTAVHAYLSHAHNAMASGASVSLAASGALAATPEEWRSLCSRLNLDVLPVGREGFESEVPVALNVHTGEARRLNVDELVAGIDGGPAKYPDLGRGWICGTLDVVGPGYCADYKTGRGGSYRWQMIMAALAWSRITGVDSVTTVIVRIHDDGESHEERPVVHDAFDLATLRAEIAAAYDAWMSKPSSIPVPTPGSHCTYCPSWQACPAKVGLVKRAYAENGVEQLEQLGMAAITAEDMARALAVAARLKEAAGRIEAQAHKVVAATGQQYALGDGEWFGAYETRGTQEWDGERAFDVVREVLGDTCALTAVEKIATKASVQRAVDLAKEMGRVEKNKGAATLRRITSLLELAGGIKTSPPKQRIGRHRNAPAGQTDIAKVPEFSTS